MAEIEGIVPDIDKNAERCLCQGCSTPNECMKCNDKRLFYSGDIKCDLEKRGCI